MRTSVTTTQTQTVTIKPTVQRKLLTELHGYAAIHKEMKGLDAGKKTHSSAVLDLAVANVDAEKFELEGFKIAVVKGALDKRLNKEALVKRLVKDGKYSLKAALALMEDCTSEKPKKDHVRITVPGEDDEQ